VLPPLLAPAAARMRDGRAAVLGLLQRAVPPPCAADAATAPLGRTAACNAGLARLAAALGDGATAARFDELALRLRAPLLDRARVVPLLLLEQW
jgi:hypothetical protein